jgi:hypothetical protein
MNCERLHELWGPEVEVGDLRARFYSPKAKRSPGVMKPNRK